MFLAGFIASGLKVVRKSKPKKLKKRIVEDSTTPEKPFYSSMNGVKLAESKVEKDAITINPRRQSFRLVTILLKRPAPFAPVVAM